MAVCSVTNPENLLAVTVTGAMVVLLSYGVWTAAESLVVEISSNAMKLPLPLLRPVEFLVVVLTGKVLALTCTTTNSNIYETNSAHSIICCTRCKEPGVMYEFQNA